MSSEEDIYEVGEVLKDRKRRGQIEYLIRWKNFGVDEDSWEPASNLQEASALLQEYIKNKKTRKSRRSSSRSRSRSRSRTRLTRKKGEKELSSRESTPLKKSSREGTPLKKREPTPIKSLEISTPIEEDLEKEPLIKEATPPPSPPTEEPVAPTPPLADDTTDAPSPKVVTELTNEGVEETLLTTFTSQITHTETTDIFTPVSESVSTVLTRRMEMRAAAKATEEEQKIIEEYVKEQESAELIKENDVLETPVPDATPAPNDSTPDSCDPGVKPIAGEVITPAPRHSLMNVSVGKKWPIVVFVVCLLVVGISFAVEKFLRS